MPLLFIVNQVSVYYHHTSNMFIVVAPCRQVLWSEIGERCNMLILILSGDVELNPGPMTIEEILQKLLDGQAFITNEIKEVKGNQARLEDRFEKLSERIQELEEGYQSFKVCENAVFTLQNTVKEMQEKLVQLEDRSRRNNLNVFDRKCLEVNNNQKTVFQKKKLGVRVKTVERIYRLGAKRGNNTRPVIMKFFDYTEKMQVLRNCCKLKGTTISVSNDYSKKKKH
ncbi:unnamed protein product [Ixodes pacificus]